MQFSLRIPFRRCSSKDLSVRISTSGFFSCDFVPSLLPRNRRISYHYRSGSYVTQSAKDYATTVIPLVIPPEGPRDYATHKSSPSPWIRRTHLTTPQRNPGKSLPSVCFRPPTNSYPSHVVQVPRSVSVNSRAAAGHFIDVISLTHHSLSLESSARGSSLRRGLILFMK